MNILINLTNAQIYAMSHKHFNNATRKRTQVRIVYSLAFYSVTWNTIYEVTDRVHNESQRSHDYRLLFFT